MYEKTRPWRLAWFLPFNAVVFAGSKDAPSPFAQGAAARHARHLHPLRVRTLPHERVALRVARRPLLRRRHHHGRAREPALLGPPIVGSAAIELESKRARWVVAGVFFAGAVELCVAEALGAHVLAVPSPISWFVGAGAVAFTVVAFIRLGQDVEAAYTELALELATRREEVFEESEEHARSLEGVAARLAHEVKNPLAAIKGLSTHMARGASDAKTAERLGIVAQEADRLQAIVDGFLGFTRGLDDLKLSRVVPYDVARELVVSSKRARPTPA